MAKQLTKAGLEQRRAYQRQLYAKKKLEGTLPPDRYDPEKRREYNRDYYRRNKGAILEKQIDRCNEKGAKSIE